ncbi:TIGR01841 family phasin [Paraburkholderia sp. GAS348]|jgi:phasin family protein|uniref:TIGR01841 family phasin n=1 Tax=Paraburkholderia sp. GAS348 TaxID=3035132 RepID=UPI003D1D4B40
MSSLVPEQLIAAQKTGLETTVGLLSKALDGTEKLADLNVQAVKSTLVESQEILAKAFSAKEPQELLALQANLGQAAAKKVQSYCRHVYEVVSSVQTEFATTAEAQFKQQQHDAQAFIDSLAKNGPAGSEAAVAAWKAIVKTTSETANTTYEAAKKATKQAVQIAESNVSAASSASIRRTRQAVVAVDAVEK